MPDTTVSLMSPQTSRLRLRTLIMLRWVAVIGQAATVGFVHFVLQFPLLLPSVLSLVGAGVLLNVLLMASGQSQRLLSNREAASLLLFDTVQMAALLGLTGGLHNPFVILLVAPAVIAAANLRRDVAVFVYVTSVILAGVIGLYHLPLPWRDAGFAPLPPLYVLAEWLAIVVGGGFIAGFAGWVAADAGRMETALAATQDVLAKEQKLAALGSLATMTAHELGTPLATIHLVAKELSRQGQEDPHVQEDLDLIVEQSERCRHILGGLAHHKSTTEATVVPLDALLEEVVDAHRTSGKTVMVRIDHVRADAPMPHVRRRPEILHGLGAFVENAVDFAFSQVEVRARVSEWSLIIEVRDDGPGFSSEIMSKLGEPYVSSRSGGLATDEDRGGLGLGFFIAKTLLERAQARVEYGNRSRHMAHDGVAGGAYVRAAWRRAALVVEPGDRG